MLKRYLWQVLCYLCMACVLTHCSDNDDLKKYVAEISARPGAKIEPLPEAKPDELYHYSSAGTRNPFEPEAKKVKVTLGPDQKRPREELEAFALDSLKMVGTLGQGKNTWVLILAPNGGIYRVTIGNYLGKNFGHITAISPTKIDIEESIEDPETGWQPKKVDMQLTTKANPLKTQSAK